MRPRPRCWERDYQPRRPTESDRSREKAQFQRIVDGIKTGETMDHLPSHQVEAVRTWLASQVTEHYDNGQLDLF